MHINVTLLTEGDQVGTHVFVKQRIPPMMCFQLIARLALLANKSVDLLSLSCQPFPVREIVVTLLISLRHSNAGDCVVVEDVKRCAANHPRLDLTTHIPERLDNRLPTMHVR